MDTEGCLSHFPCKAMILRRSMDKNSPLSGEGMHPSTCVQNFVTQLCVTYVGKLDRGKLDLQVSNECLNDSRYIR